MKRPFVHLLCALSLAGQLMPPALAATQPELNFKIYSPESQNSNSSDKPAAGTSGALTPKSDDSVNAAPAETPAASTEKAPAASDSLWSTDNPTNTESNSNASAPPAPTGSGSITVDPTADKTAESATTSSSEGSGTNKQKTLKGYIRVVPSGTKIPIIMDTAVDSDTSQEGDEFSARTGEDLNIDGSTVVPAGSIIKGRLAQLNAPKNMGRSGSVALKFDTVTTPDNRQIPLVANLVARGGVVHARRGMKDIAMDAGTATLPTALGLGIGLLAAGSKSGTSGKSHLQRGTGAMIGAGVGAAVGIAILCIKKGKKVDVRPGDELKIELAEDLRMPM